MLGCGQEGGVGRTRNMLPAFAGKWVVSLL